MQYRMNQRLTKFANHVAYQGRLQCATDEVAAAQLTINLEVRGQNEPGGGQTWHFESQKQSLKICF